MFVEESYVLTTLMRFNPCILDENTEKCFWSVKIRIWNAEPAWDFQCTTVLLFMCFKDTDGWGITRCKTPFLVICLQNQPLSIYERPLIKCKIVVYEWVNFSKFSPIWAKIAGWNLWTLWKIWLILLKMSGLGRLVYEWVTFSWKIGICMGLLSNACQNQTWVPPSSIRYM